MHDTPVWTPSREQIEKANLTAFIEQVRRTTPSVSDYPSLYKWSVDSPGPFWAEVWRFADVLHSQPWREVVDDPSKLPGAKWFDGARLNFAQNLLRWDDEAPALVFWNENGPGGKISHSRLRRLVGRLATSLSGHGIQAGDRVAGFLPNLPETVIAMLAAASLGAIWSSCSPDFGVKGVLDRFGQIRPRVLFGADGYIYAGKRIDCRERIADIVDRIPEIEHVVLVPYLEPRPHAAAIPRCVHWDDFLTAEARTPKLEFRQLPFDHPLYVMYSSGTTGLPKCMVHGAGGTLIQHLKEHKLHTDLKPGDVLFYYTTCGWMMWNWLVSGLASGATVLLYDGSPFHPRGDILFEMAEREQVTVFGTSAKYLALLEKKGFKPAGSHNLGGLKTILSTGSPLAPASYDYVYKSVRADVCLASISGGTDLISCFALGNPIAPVYRGEIQTRGLGMRVEIFDEAGEPIRGEAGELVCTQAFPSMPVAFWNDPEGEKYHHAYFDHYPGVWRHGDWAELTDHDGVVIHGRSDATLNPGGVRIGTAEIYRQVEKLPEVVESLAVAQERDGDLRLVLFVRLRGGIRLGGDLVQAIKKVIRENTSPHHVPKKIVQVADIPRTISGKITELAVRDVIHGRPVKNADALANPEALELFRDLPELRD